MAGEAAEFYDEGKKGAATSTGTAANVVPICLPLFIVSTVAGELLAVCTDKEVAERMCDDGDEIVISVVNELNTELEISEVRTVIKNFHEPKLKAAPTPVRKPKSKKSRRVSDAWGNTYVQNYDDEEDAPF